MVAAVLGAIRISPIAAAAEIPAKRGVKLRAKVHESATLG
jgi:hypothetical protein